MGKVDPLGLNTPNPLTDEPPNLLHLSSGISFETKTVDKECYTIPTPSDFSE